VAPHEVHGQDASAATATITTTAEMTSLRKSR